MLSSLFISQEVESKFKENGNQRSQFKTLQENKHLKFDLNQSHIIKTKQIKG